MREEDYYDDVIPLFSHWSIPDLKDYATCHGRAAVARERRPQQEGLAKLKKLRPQNLYLWSGIIANCIILTA